MARLPLAIIPQSHRVPEPCRDCTIASVEAVESAAKKRGKKTPDAVPPGTDPETPSEDEVTHPQD